MQRDGERERETEREREKHANLLRGETSLGPCNTKVLRKAAYLRGAEISFLPPGTPKIIQKGDGRYLILFAAPFPDNDDDDDIVPPPSEEEEEKAPRSMPPPSSPLVPFVDKDTWDMIFMVLLA